MHNLSDKALKERIIGAVVLVVFAVLIVPIFLGGPPSESQIVSEAVTLPGQNNQAQKQQTIVLDRDRSQPVPASRTQEAPQSAQQPSAPPPQAAKETEVSTPQQSEPARATAAEATVAEEVPESAAKTSTTGMWAVQLGSFSGQENAERLASTLREQGYAAFLSQVQRDSGPLHRVRIGPQKDRESADEIAAQLAKSGHNGQVVPHP